MLFKQNKAKVFNEDNKMQINLFKKQINKCVFCSFGISKAFLDICKCIFI